MSTEYDAAVEIKAGLDNIANELPTLRQLYAGMAMQGMLSNGADITVTIPILARDAVRLADALIAELNKDK